MNRTLENRMTPTVRHPEPREGCLAIVRIEEQADSLHPDVLEETVASIVRRFHGNAVGDSSEGWRLRFGTPVEAVQAAIELQRDLDRSQRSSDFPIRIRIGLDLGDSRKELRVGGGSVPRLIDRLVEVCPGASILLSRQVYEALGPFYRQRCVQGPDLPISKWRGEDRSYDLTWRPPELTRALPGDARLDLEVLWSGAESRIALRGSMEAETALMSYVVHSLDLESIEKTSRSILQTVNSSNREGSVRDAVRQLRELGQNLFSLLIPPEIAERIRASGAEFLRLKLDDDCVHLPWELLHDGNDFLCCRFSLGRLVRTRQSKPLRRRERPVEKASFLTLSNPTGDLPATTEEGRELYTRFQSDPRVHFEWMNGHIPANTVLEILPQFDMVHYCGHSELKMDNPDESGWVLSEGRLTAGSLVEWVETNRAAPLLVFNNGCHGGTTKSWKENLAGWSHGLANAFLLAGANHYIGAVSELLDRSSRDFSGAFYEAVFAGHPVGRALKEARIRRRGRTGEDNLTWAQYVLYGDPEGTLFADLSVPENLAVSSSERRLNPEEQPASASMRGHPEPTPLSIPNPNSASGAFHSSSPTLGWIGALVIVVLLLIGVGLIGYQRLSGSPDSGDLRSRIGVAESLMNSGGLVQAQEVLQGILDQGVRDQGVLVDAYRLLGRLADAKGDSGDSLKWRREALQISQSDAGLWADQGVLLQRAGDHDAALASYEKAAALNPDDPFIQSLLRSCLSTIRHRQSTDWNRELQENLRRLREMLAAGTPQKEAIDEWTSRPLGMALLEWESHGAPSERLGQEESLIARLEYEIFQSGKGFVVERDRLDAILAELQIGASELSDSRYAPAIGRLFAARGLIAGTLDRSAEETTLALRFIDTESRLLKAVAVASTSGEIENVLPNLVSDLMDDLETPYPVQGRIASASEPVSLNIGTLHGVRMGQKFRVYPLESGPREAASVTGLPPVGEVEIVGLGDRDSVCKVTRADLDLQPGMRVRIDKTESGD